MSLKGQITEDMKSAMKAGEKDRLKVVRLMLAAIKQIEIDTREELDDAAVLGVITKMVKQRRDSVEQFEKGDREDLAEIERAEIVVLNDYLPEQLTAEELTKMVDEIILSRDCMLPLAAATSRKRLRSSPKPLLRSTTFARREITKASSANFSEKILT